MNRRDVLKKTAVIGACLVLPATGVAVPEPAGQKTPVIDAHSHAGHGQNAGRDGDDLDPWTTYNPPEWTLAHMQEAGIGRSIIFPITNVTYEKANEEIAAYVRRWPEKFIGFAKHDAKTEAGRIRDMLRREVREWGLRGLKLHGTPSSEMVEAAEELGIPILFHPGRVNDALDMIAAHPRVSFILAHLGSFASQDWREHVRAIDAAKRLPNLCLDTSSVVFGQYLEQAARELPAEKLIFGSDGPLVDSRVELHKVRLLKLGPEKERLVLGGNILRLIGSR